MKFELYGKIVSRRVAKLTNRKTNQPYDLYSVVIEEPGIYPSLFQVSTKSPSMLGPKDGMFAVGRWCTVRGFVNGREREATSRDGKRFKAYSTTMTLSSIETAEPPAVDPASGESTEGVADDIPF